MKNYGKETNVSNVILTKMDSSSKGGIALSMVKKFETKIAFICNGETLQDIKSFDAEDFVNELVE